MRQGAVEIANDATCAPLDEAPSCVDANDLVNAAFALEAIEDFEPPFDPPDISDFDAPPEFDDEDGTVFAAPAPSVEAPGAAPERDESVELIVEDEVILLEVEEEEPPFDAPDESDECFQPPLALPVLNEERAPERAELLLTRNERPLADSRAAQSFPRTPRTEDEAAVRAAPAITVLACWDRVETGDMLTRIATDRRLARAEIYSEPGGVDSAIRYAGVCLPDLVIIESTLKRDPLLAALDRLAPCLGQGARVIVLGAENDISLLRDLAVRGVSQYIVAPIGDEEVVRGICALYAERDNARVIAVVGARGGVGASTLAYNLAWTIAERQQVGTALLDLDVAFGSAAFNSATENALSAVDILEAPSQLEDAALAGKLNMLTAPATLRRLFEPSADAATDLIARVRRTSPVIVLDVPHAWSPWVKQALVAADDVLIVASPDLASLRNAEHIMHALRAARPADADPFVVLSMTGVAKRPEIAAKDFTETLKTSPVATFAFEPEVFGVAEVARQALGQSAPRSKAATTIDTLATMLTGRETADRKKQPLQALSRSAKSPVPVPADADPPAPVAPDVTTAAPEARADVGALSPIEIAPFEAPKPTCEAASLEGPRPFTFRAEAAPLELVQLAPSEEEEALAKAREAAISDVARVQAKHVRRGRPGLIRAVACVLMLAAFGVWYAQAQREAAAAAPIPAPEIATPTLAPMAPATRTPLSPAHQFEAALQTLARGDVETGVSQLRAVAESGFAPAQYQLAKLYEHGEGVATDLTLAREWTERAASAGDSRAMHDLGVYYARGEGVSADDAAAFRWFRQAAEQGVVDSQYNLAVLYEEGRGVAQNEAEALFWFLTAGRAGDLHAIQRANALEVRLAPMFVDQAHARALAFRPSHAQ
ncbi:AAA family ATPase [Vitreimonas flagellata]|uniref:AAA family ATPase n=1 Tax=Vitreimonas flagellata TaxID=2560861 RepID=UPI001074AE62|nr:AAA family ATPase [Vitreimonas flagellata]